MANEFFEEKERHKKALVVACYQWDWQEVLTIEAAVDLKSRSYEVQYLDLSSYSASLLKNLQRKILRNRSNMSKRNQVLESNHVSIIKPRILIILCKLQYLLYSILHFLPHKDWATRWDIVYPGLVDLTGDININQLTQKSLVRKSLTSEYFFNKILKIWTVGKQKFDLIIIVNGRFPLNRSAANFFTQQNQKVELIEFGANREKFQIFTISPHSMINRLQLFRQFTEQVSVTREEISEVGGKFFKDRRIFDKQANISWTRRMKSSELPNIQSTKVCTFFSTSEREFVGVRDLVKEGEFPDQFSALEALILCLGAEWRVFIRRHPMAKDLKADPEAELWAKFEKFENVEIIQPDSEIDSYELGMKSNIVAHFGSFIGPELIFAGHKEVITLGHTQWEDLDPDRHLFGQNTLRNYLENPPKHEKAVDISLLGYFMATFGQDFKVCHWDEGKLVWTLAL